MMYNNFSNHRSLDKILDHFKKNGDNTIIDILDGCGRQPSLKENRIVPIDFNKYIHKQPHLQPDNQQ